MNKNSMNQRSKLCSRIYFYLRSEAGDRSGISSIFGGGEFTPEIDIRKQVPVQQSSYDTSDKPLYQVIEPVNVFFLSMKDKYWRISVW